MTAPAPAINMDSIYRSARTFRFHLDDVVPEDLAAAMPFCDLDYMSSMAASDQAFYQQLQADSTLRAAFIDICKPPSRQEYNYYDSDPLKLSHKMTCERGLFHRLHFEALDAIRVCRVMTATGISTNERTRILDLSQDKLHNMVDLLQDCQAFDSQGFDLMLKCVRELYYEFPHLCMDLPPSHSWYLEMLKYDSDHLKGVRDCLADTMEDDEHLYGYEPATLVAFDEPTAVVDDGYHLASIDRSYMTMRAYYDHLFCRQLLQDDCLVEIVQEFTKCRAEPVPFDAMGSAEAISLKMTADRAMLGRIDYEVDQVKRMFVFCDPRTNLDPKVKIEIAKTAIEKAEYVCGLLCYWPGSLVQAELASLAEITKDLKTMLSEMEAELGLGSETAERAENEPMLDSKPAS